MFVLKVLTYPKSCPQARSVPSGLKSIALIQPLFSNRRIIICLPVWVLKPLTHQSPEPKVKIFESGEKEAVLF